MTPKIVKFEIEHVPETTEHGRADRFTAVLEDGSLHTLHYGYYEEQPQDLEWIELPPVPGTAAAQQAEKRTDGPNASSRAFDVVQ